MNWHPYGCNVTSDIDGFNLNVIETIGVGFNLNTGATRDVR